jgi:hypothetical protein
VALSIFRAGNVARQRVSFQYRGWDPDLAVEDYYKRVRDREKHYEPVEEKIWPFIRIINVGDPLGIESVLVTEHSITHQVGEKIMVNVRNTLRLCISSCPYQLCEEANSRVSPSAKPSHSFSSVTDLEPVPDRLLPYEHPQQLPDHLLCTCECRDGTPRGLTPVDNDRILNFDSPANR